MQSSKQVGNCTDKQGCFATAHVYNRLSILAALASALSLLTQPKRHACSAAHWMDKLAMLLCVYQKGSTFHQPLSVVDTAYIQT